MSGENLTIDNWMVAWDPDEPEAVKVGPRPDRTRWSDRYQFTDGCCMVGDWSEFNPDQKVGQMFVIFHTLVVRDGIDPRAAHREFLKIDEYRRRISPDIEGAHSDNAGG